MEEQKEELIAIAAADSHVPVDVIRRLLALEAEFDDFTVYGTKAQFSRAVARILDDATLAIQNSGTP